METMTMTMPAHDVEVVFEAKGENRGTYDPICFLSSFTGDMQEKVKRFINADWDQLVDVDRYIVRKIRLPKWVNEKFFMANEVELRYAKAYGFDVANTTESQFNQIRKLGDKQAILVAKWLKSNPRKEYTKARKARVLSWLNGESDYDLPVSPREFQNAMQYERFPDSYSIRERAEMALVV